MFANPQILFALAVVPILALLYLFWGRKFRVATRKLASDDTRAMVIKSEPVPLRWLRSILVLGALALFVVALARPLGGVEYSNVESKGIDIVLAMDISKSMLAQDFTPNRLEYMKRTAKNIVRSSKGDRFAIVAFAGDAYVHMPLTSDRTTALAFIDRLDINFEIPQGTAIGDAVQTSVDRFIGGDENAKVIILFTDGESNKGTDPVKAARNAADKGVVVFPVGIGDEKGTYIPESDYLGRTRYKVDPQGNRVMVKLDEGALKKIASITGGLFYNASDAKQMMTIYTQLDRSTAKTYQARHITKSQELAPLFLVAGLILLFMESGLNYLAPAVSPRGRGRYLFER